MKKCTPENTVGLIAAAGAGDRLSQGPKAFLKLGSKSLLRIAVELLIPVAKKIRVAVPPDFLSRAEAELMILNHDIEVLAGGVTRQASFQNLLANQDADYVLAHEAARPFASPDLVRRVASEWPDGDVVLPTVHSYIPIVVAKAGQLHDCIPSQDAHLSQAPQRYKRIVLQQAFEWALERKSCYQSLWQMAAAAGYNVNIVEGNRENFKITDNFDWNMALALHGNAYPNGN